MYKAKIAIKHDKTLHLSFLEFTFNKRKLVLAFNGKGSRCFITNFDLKHQLVHSAILTSVKAKEVGEERLIEIYRDINVELLKYDAIIAMTEQEWIEFIFNKVY